MKCETCFYFQQRQTSVKAGECHKNPPTLYSTPTGRDCGWPPVNDDDWCGAWTDKPSEHPGYTSHG